MFFFIQKIWDHSTGKLRADILFQFKNKIYNSNLFKYKIKPQNLLISFLAGYVFLWNKKKKSIKNTQIIKLYTGISSNDFMIFCFLVEKKSVIPAVPFLLSYLR